MTGTGPPDARHELEEALREPLGPAMLLGFKGIDRIIAIILRRLHQGDVRVSKLRGQIFQPGWINDVLH